MAPPLASLPPSTSPNTDHMGTTSSVKGMGCLGDFKIRHLDLHSREESEALWDRLLLQGRTRAEITQSSLIAQRFQPQWRAISQQTETKILTLEDRINPSPAERRSATGISEDSCVRRVQGEKDGHAPRPISAGDDSGHDGVVHHWTWRDPLEHLWQPVFHVGNPRPLLVGCGVHRLWNFSILADRYPSPCLVTLTVGVNLITATLAITAIVFYLVDEGARFGGDASLMNQNNLNTCLLYQHLLQPVAIGVRVLLVVFAVLQLCVTISVAALDITALTKSMKKKQVSEVQQPLMEEVAANPVA
ncbi:hypothetical protein AAFF_G00169870 [Aldrovandia affinis]|uniref:Uncharacterized protein n=1 Tax=Aldrovandia affinis TaxID=143900 RepID=A0AAD7W7C9_9TELE|nr:hypothetical protein AAFF_G00169870 [Aldrovandia affinis]